MRDTEDYFRQQASQASALPPPVTERTVWRKLLLWGAWLTIAYFILGGPLPRFGDNKQKEAIQTASILAVDPRWSWFFSESEMALLIVEGAPFIEKYDFQGYYDLVFSLAQDAGLRLLRQADQASAEAWHAWHLTVIDTVRLGMGMRAGWECLAPERAEQAPDPASPAPSNTGSILPMPILDRLLEVAKRLKESDAAGERNFTPLGDDVLFDRLRTELAAAGYDKAAFVNLVAGGSEAVVGDEQVRRCGLADFVLLRLGELTPAEAGSLWLSLVAEDSGLVAQ